MIFPGKWQSRFHPYQPWHPLYLLRASQHGNDIQRSRQLNPLTFINPARPDTSSPYPAPQAQAERKSLCVFINKDLGVAMEELARWYVSAGIEGGIQVAYEDFKGMMLLLGCWLAGRCARR
jgi:hypothetical protein